MGMRGFGSSPLVHYTTNDECFPFLVTSWDGEPGEPRTASGWLFTGIGIIRQQDVRYSPHREPLTWHWPHEDGSA